VKWFSLSLFGFLSLLIVGFAYTRPERVNAVADNTGAFFDALGATLILTMQIGVGVGVVMAVIGATWLGVRAFNSWQDGKDQRRRMVDGAFPMVEYRLPGGAKGFWNPNASLDEFAVMGKQGFMSFSNPEFGPDRRLTAKLAHEQVNAFRAVFPGDAARTDEYGYMSQMPKGGGSGRLKQLMDKQKPSIIAETPEGAILEGELNPHLTTGEAALRMSRPDKWILGQEPVTNGHAVFRPVTDVHAAVVGATGSGKTKSVGYLMALNAVRSGGRLVILDADNGVDWRRFASHAEWHETDAGVFEDQLAAVMADKLQRDQVLQAHNLDEIGADPAVLRDYPRTFVFIEEYGSLLASLRGSGAARAHRVDNMLDELMRKARKCGIHIVLFDQYPDKWTDQTLVNAKTKYVFQIDGGKGAKVSAHNAGLLDLGEFILRGTKYNSFDMGKEYAALLTAIPAPAHPALIDGAPKPAAQPVPTVVEDGVPEWEASYTGAMPDPKDAPKRDVIYAWRDRNPTGSQADFRQWLSSQHGMEYARGYVSDCFKEWDALQQGD